MSKTKKLINTLNSNIVLKTLVVLGLLLLTIKALFGAWIIHWDLVDIMLEQRSLLLGASMFSFWLVIITFFIKDKTFFKKYGSLKIFYIWLIFRFIIGRLLFEYFTRTTPSDFNVGFLDLTIPTVYIPLVLIFYDFAFLFVIIFTKSKGRKLFSF